MPIPQREPLRRLSRTERAALQRIARSRSDRVDQVRRASALLAGGRTGVFLHASREAGLGSGTTVADLVARFNRRGLAALQIGSGRGRRPTYTASARAQIVATAQREPDRRTDGTATWSLTTLQRTLDRASVDCPQAIGRSPGPCSRVAGCSSGAGDASVGSGALLKQCPVDPRAASNLEYASFYASISIEPAERAVVLAAFPPPGHRSSQTPSLLRLADR